MMTNRKLLYYLNFIPLKFNFFYFVIILTIAYYTDSIIETVELNSSRIKIIRIITLGFLALVLFVSFLTSFLPWISFLFKKRILEKDEDERKDIIKIYFQKSGYESGDVPIDKIDILGIRRPPLGFAKIRIVYGNYKVSDKILINEALKEKKSRKHIGIRGQGNLWLPNVRDNPIISSIIFFEDMFQIFSFPYLEIEHMGIYTTPSDNQIQNIDILPNNTEEEIVRVFTKKKLEGEYLNYKKFESGDDVRRIVWKIYAKNRELIVRIPDKVNPYTSHVSLYASFHHGFPKYRHALINDFFLDFFKGHVRNVSQSIQSSGYSVKYFPDQTFRDFYHIEDYNKRLFQLSSSIWHDQKDLYQYLNQNQNMRIKAPFVLCISSLCPVEKLAYLTSDSTRLAVVYWIKMSEVFKYRKQSILKYFVISPEPTEYQKATGFLKTWKYKQQLKKNEAAIESLFKSRKITVLNYETA